MSETADNVCWVGEISWVTRGTDSGYLAPEDPLLGYHERQSDGPLYCEREAVGVLDVLLMERMASLRAAFWP